MTAAAPAPSPDELHERIGKLNDHIGEFEAKVELWNGESKGHFATVLAELKDDRDATAAALHKVSDTAGDEWRRVAGATSRSFERIEAELQAAWSDLEAELAQDAKAYRAAVERELESWHGYVDRLRVQANLAGMEARDVMTRVEHAFDAARPQLEQALESTEEAFRSLRTNVRDVVTRLWAAARDASRQLP